MPYITATEAAALTGKSQATISRLCAKHAGDPALKKEGRSWLIDRDWLLQQVGIKESGVPFADEYSRNFDAKTSKVEPEPENMGKTHNIPGADIHRMQTEIIDLLKDENKYLRVQLDKQTERNKELNYLMGNMQKQLQASKQEPAPKKPRKDIIPYTLLGVAILFLVFVAIVIYLHANR